MILGAILAGGQASRFGSDKALAELDGRSLIALAVEALGAQCDHVIVVGRVVAPVPTVPDWPRPGMGPLGGLAGALRHALAEGYHQVLTCGVDAAALPGDLAEWLSPGPACLEEQPVIGLWPAAAAPVLEAFLQRDERHAVKRFADLVGARRVRIDTPIPNINTPLDLAAEQARRRHPRP